MDQLALVQIPLREAVASKEAFLPKHLAKNRAVFRLSADDWQVVDLELANLVVVVSLVVHCLEERLEVRRHSFVRQEGHLCLAGEIFATMPCTLHNSYS